jgi:hypothetical protein
MVVNKERVIGYMSVMAAATIIIFAIIGVARGEDKYAKINQERNMAINGCVQCKLQELDRYYFFTCNETEYSISRENWVKLNASICE